MLWSAFFRPLLTLQDSVLVREEEVLTSQFGADFCFLQFLKTNNFEVRKMGVPHISEEIPQPDKEFLDITGLEKFTPWSVRAIRGYMTGPKPLLIEGVHWNKIRGKLIFIYPRIRQLLYEGEQRERAPFK